MNAVRLPIPTTAGQRSLGPDAVRALGALLVVYLHACVPYLTHCMPGLVWPVRESGSIVCDFCFWAIEIFVMPLFLLISGVFSYRALRSTDAHVFLKARVRRLLRPLLFAVVVILPIELYIWLIGLVADGLIPAAKMRSLKIPSPYGDNLWGLSHLWYLLYVFLYAAAMVGAARLLRDQVPMRLRPLVRQVTAIAIIAVGTVTLTFAPEVVFGFQHSFIPIFSKWVYSGTFFAGGVAIAIFDPSFRTIDRLASRHLALGVIATIAAVVLGCWSLRVEDLGSQTAGSASLASLCLASTTVLAAWSVTLGTFGMANRISPALAESKRVCQSIQYLAGASFWIYLVHHGIVGLIHTDLKWLFPGLAPFLKSIITAAIAIVCGLVSYEALIRTTRFGQWIGLSNPQVAEPSTATGNVETAHQRPSIRTAA